MAIIKKKHKSLEDYISFGFGFFFIFIALALFVISKPFDSIDTFQPLETSTQEESNTVTIQSNSATQGNKSVSEVHNYETIYGDKDIDANSLNTIETFLSNAFNIGYRSIVNSEDAYITNVSENFTDAKVSFGSYKFTGEQFPKFIANLVGEQQMQLSCEYDAIAAFEEDNVITVNGDLYLTIHSALDTATLSSFFDLESMELNTEYTIPVTFTVSETTGLILSFSYDYTEVSSN